MPHHFNCCVPQCTNNFRNKPNLEYYRIPKCEKARKYYKVSLRNESLKLDSSQTRICSEHFEGGQKLSRNHLPTIFPWTKERKSRREIFKHDFVPKKRKVASVVVSTTDTDSSYSDNNANIVTQTTPTSTESLHEDPYYTREVQPEEILNNFREEQHQYLSKHTQTDIDLASLEEVLNEVSKLKEENKQLRDKCDQLTKENKHLNFISSNSEVFNIEKYKDNPDDIAFYTGLSDYEMLMMCYNLVKDSAKNISYNYERIYCDLESTKQPGRPRALSTFQEFIMTLVRIRLGLFERDLGHRFNVSHMSVSRITNSWLRFLRSEFEPLIQIPPDDVLKFHMPKVFKEICPDTVVIVDCTEFQMEKPSSLDAQSACYSSYKSTNTMKALLGITPSGVVCFVSELFPGSTSDLEITMQSGFLGKLKRGDEVMADKGFNCQDELASVGVVLVKPNFLKDKKQFSTKETEHNKTIASLRVHVERLMERIKNWHIFYRKIPISMSPVASDILIVVAALSNFLPPLID